MPAVLVPVWPAASRLDGEVIPFRMWRIRCDRCGVLSDSAADRQRDAIEWAGVDGWAIEAWRDGISAVCTTCRQNDDNP